jgi:hypothetical protein
LFYYITFQNLTAIIKFVSGGRCAKRSAFESIPGTNVIKHFTNVYDKLECLSQAGL